MKLEVDRRVAMLVGGLLGAAATGYSLAWPQPTPFGGFGGHRIETRLVLAAWSFLVPFLVRGRDDRVLALGAPPVGAGVLGTAWVFATGPGNLWPLSIALLVSSTLGPTIVGGVAGLVVHRAMWYIGGRLGSGEG